MKRLARRSDQAGAWAAACRAAVLLLASSGCVWGTRPWNYGPATSPAGAQVAVRVRGESADRVGELYAADSAGVVVRAGRLVRVAWPRVAALDVAGQGDRFDVLWGETVAPATWGQLALVSRFPQGLQGELLREVLRRAGQDSLEVVR
jgi:hypothetical protein